MHEDGTISDTVTHAVSTLVTAGHEVMLATGRAVAATLPVLERFGLEPEYVVCSNGAITLKRDPTSLLGYRHEIVETFDPSTVLMTIRSHLGGGHYAVEDETGFYRYTDPFPASTLGIRSEHVTFDELLNHEATRVVVFSPDHNTDEFLEIVERMGLQRVSYAIGWTAWLDISPDGVNKATALERVRTMLNISRSRILAVGDGRNDIDMLRWAGEHGHSAAMGQAPEEVREAARWVTGNLVNDGAAQAMATIFEM
jgi:Cof subfamily protein (haloacid dehalogenase superfamily)